MKKGKLVQTIDIGDAVLCDMCNQQYSDKDKRSGGYLFGSKAVCPDCAPDMLKTIKGYNEEDYIKAYCPESMSFYRWVIDVLRGGKPGKIEIHKF